MEKLWLNVSTERDLRMGNGISSEREGLSRSPRSSSAEESPPAKRWTAARGRADGLGPSSRAESSAHQLPISSVLQEPVDGSSSSQLGGSLTAPANKKNDRPTSRNPQTPTPKRRKIHKRLEAHSGGARRRSSFVDTRPQNNTTVTPTTANESCAPVTPRIRRASPIRTTEMIVLSDSSKSNDDDLVPDFQKENLVSYEDPFSELEQLISKSAVGISRSGAGGELGGKRNGLAYVKSLSSVVEISQVEGTMLLAGPAGREHRAVSNVSTYHSQLYRAWLMLETKERANSSAFGTAPAALDDAAWTLQRAWERTGPLRAEAIRLAWERYSGELSDYEMREAERRSKGVHTGASSLIPFPTTAGASSRTILHSSPPTQEIAKRRVVPGMSNGRGGDNLPNREQETTLPEDQDFVGKEVFEKSRGVAPGWLDRQLFSAFDNKSPNSQYAALDRGRTGAEMAPTKAGKPPKRQSSGRPILLPKENIQQSQGNQA
ncbi:hypothetical protein CONLIGDRAFT_643331 [Coniochaeta ligniaria NRRL 30616]|uniref:Uncharacterized protein n=1 Tax=Coniochaeta ligniaria NRRL 30616 TaxID=1408157 RepID=A0A1J7JPS6_9PEZI|nr:hypothetical protein CONLIGDRAFT_643331 [Coniochaeta ligniaria NRRL 30616]